MAPPKASKSKKRKTVEEEEVSHVSQTEDEANVSDDPFVEEDYIEPIRKIRKVSTKGRTETKQNKPLEKNENYRREGKSARIRGECQHFQTQINAGPD